MESLPSVIVGGSSNLSQNVAFGESRIEDRGSELGQKITVHRSLRFLLHLDFIDIVQMQDDVTSRADKRSPDLDHKRPASSILK